MSVLRWLAPLVVLAGLGVFIFAKADPRPRAVEAGARSELGYLVTVQAEYLVEHERYATDLESLRYTGSVAVLVQLNAHERGWSATASAQDVGFLKVDIACSVYVGELGELPKEPVDLSAVQPTEVRCKQS
jgi:hypothetical protein